MSKAKENKLTIIDLFAGYIGLSGGFIQSGKYEALDSNLKACKIYNY